MVLNHICDYLTVVNTENTVKNEVRPNILTSCHTIPYFTKTYVLYIKILFEHKYFFFLYLLMNIFL